MQFDVSLKYAMRSLALAGDEYYILLNNIRYICMPGCGNTRISSQKFHSKQMYRVGSEKYLPVKDS